MTEYVGFDVSKEETAFCVKDGSGKILARGKVATDPQALFEVLKEHCLCPARMVMETGTLSGWLSRALATRGITVDVIDARQPQGSPGEDRPDRCREVATHAHRMVPR
jgi:transposase